MSILIKGMEMPKDYSVIVKIFPDGRVGTIPYVQWFKVDLIPGTQAVPVPPHGRLIESKAFLQVAHETDDFSLDEFAHLAVLVAATPTVIPADPAEEDE